MLEQTDRLRQCAPMLPTLQVVAPRVAQHVIDAAIQAHGGGGVSQVRGGPST